MVSSNVLIKVDSHEPELIEQAIKQSALVVRANLNMLGFADYVWSDWKGGVEQAERKQPGEILSGFEKVEEQLRKHLASYPQTMLLVEGMVTPVSDGCQLWVMQGNGSWRPGRRTSVPYARYEGWLQSVARQGVLVWQTSCWQATAEAVYRFAKHAMQPEHTTLNRYLKVKTEWHPNPQVQTLMGIKGVEIGPVTAEAMIQVFGTVWNLLNQQPEIIAEMVPGVGIHTANKLLTAVGRRMDDAGSEQSSLLNL